MKFPYKVKFNGIHYEAGVEVPMPVSVDKENKDVPVVEPKNDTGAKVAKKSKK